MGNFPLNPAEFNFPNSIALNRAVLYVISYLDAIDGNREERTHILEFIVLAR